MAEDTLPPQTPDSSGEPSWVGRYAVLRRIGSGGFADVFLGRDPETSALLALKVLREDVDPGLRDQVRARFLAEEAIANVIGHRAVVRIQETSARGERPCFIAMEYVDGLPFCEHFRRVRADEHGFALRGGAAAYAAEVARLGHEVAEAMAVAHGKGVVHRDLKPDNVLVSRSGSAARVRILDFGIAKAPARLFALDRAATVTRYFTDLGTVMGSPPYMAPEQHGGAHAVTGKADVHALGVMLLIALLGLDAGALEQGERHLVLPAEFDALVAGAAIPSAVCQLLRRMVDHDPEDRPSMTEVALGLQRAAQPDARFGAAVEAWLRDGRLPRRRALLEMSECATDSHLTRDELRFLARAPAEKLARARRWMVVTVGFGMLAGICGAAAAAMALRPVGLARAMDALAALAPVRESPPAPVAPRSARLDEQTRAREAEVEAQRAKELESGLQERQRKLEAQSRISQEQAATIRALRADVAEQKGQRAQAESRLTVVEARARSLEQGQAECRTEGEQLGEALVLARRELAAKAQELAETTERLRLCSKNLRDREATSAPPEATELTN